MYKGGFVMGLFGGTKNYIYSIGKNHAPMDYGSFVDTFREYIKSEEVANLLKDGGFSMKDSEVKYTPYIEGGEPSDYPYAMVVTLEPYGTITFTIEMRGEKQGLALIYFGLKISAELQKSDKAWIIGFCKAVHAHYEKVYESYNTDKGPLFDFTKYV